MKIVWSPLAISRAGEAAKFIARDRPGAAETWVEGLFEAVTKLSRFPESGRIVPEVGDPLFRELFHGAYRVVYRLGNDRVEILTVRHGKRRFDPDEVVKPARRKPLR